jgi:KDO2-lipid IV(A) lauroyltransferase
LLLAAVTGVCRTLPLETGYRLADLASDLHRRLSRRRRQAVEQNLRVLVGAPPSRVVRDVFRCHGRFVFELLRGPDREARCRLEGREAFERAHARGRGVVLAVPHTGNFEVGGAALARAGFPIHAVAGIQLTPRWTEELRRRQERAGLPILPPGIASWRRLPRLLARGEVVALLVDGDLFHGGLVLDAFGAPAPFPLGPAKLCARTGAALLPAYALRTPDGGHVARFLDEIPVEALGVQGATERLAATLADVLRRHPDQWMIFRPLFASPADAPETEASR